MVLIFAGINIRGNFFFRKKLYFAGTNFRESTEMLCKFICFHAVFRNFLKKFYFAVQIFAILFINRRKARKLVPAKISTIKVFKSLTCHWIKNTELKTAQSRARGLSESKRKTVHNIFELSLASFYKISQNERQSVGYADWQKLTSTAFAKSFFNRVQLVLKELLIIEIHCACDHSDFTLTHA